MDNETKLRYNNVRSNSRNDFLWVKNVLRQIMVEGKIGMAEVVNFYSSLDKDGRQYGKL